MKIMEISFLFEPIQTDKRTCYHYYWSYLLFMIGRTFESPSLLNLLKKHALNQWLVKILVSNTFFKNQFVTRARLDMKCCM